MYPVLLSSLGVVVFSRPSLSEPFSFGRVVSLMCPPGEFDMNETVTGFVGGTVLDDFPGYTGVEKALKVLHLQHCAHVPCGRVVVIMRLPDEFDVSYPVTGVRLWHWPWRSCWVLVFSPVALCS